MTVGLYVTNVHSGTVHIVGERMQWLPEHGRGRMLCGHTANWELFVEGDETTSGHAATCGSCKRVFQRRQTKD